VCCPLFSSPSTEGVQIPQGRFATSGQGDGETGPEPRRAGSPHAGVKDVVGLPLPSVPGQPALTFVAPRRRPSSLPAIPCPGRRMGALSSFSASSPLRSIVLGRSRTLTPPVPGWDQSFRRALPNRAPRLAPAPIAPQGWARL